MSFLLKIVEGPNKGAEIALVDGVSVTLGKGDDCDIVLADPTLPDTPLALEASDSGVTIDGEPLAPLHVKSLGATSFAVGPADAPWGPLVWPAPEDAAADDPGAGDSTAGDAKPEDRAGEAPKGGGQLPDGPGKSASPETADKPTREGKSRLGCVISAIVLLALFFALAWFLLGRGAGSGAPGDLDPLSSDGLSPSPLSVLAERYGLTIEEAEGDVAKVSGNFATRRERLAATAAFYEARPGIELDLSDDESLRTAAEDTLSLLSEADLRVLASTNRVIALSGRARDIRRTLEALAADLPKLRDVDVSQVVLASGGAASAGAGAGESFQDAAGSASRVSADSAALREKSVPSLPVCGILTAPYPCLVLRSGARVMEGAPLGDGVVLKIEADSVTITNAAGRFTWKP